MWQQTIYFKWISFFITRRLNAFRTKNRKNNANGFELTSSKVHQTDLKNLEFLTHHHQWRHPNISSIITHYILMNNLMHPNQSMLRWWSSAASSKNSPYRRSWHQIDFVPCPYAWESIQLHCDEGLRPSKEPASAICSMNVYFLSWKHKT